MSARTLLSTTLCGAMMAMVFVLGRSLWVASLHHAAWNFTIFASGLPLTGDQGWRASAPLDSTAQGSDWLTGMPAGPEDSLLNLLLMAAAVAVMVLWQRRTVPEGAASDGSAGAGASHPVGP